LVTEFLFLLDGINKVVERLEGMMFNKLDPSANESFARKNRAHSITIEISSNVSWAIEVTQVLLTQAKRECVQTFTLVVTDL
jgi:hypothetical protein